MAVGSHGFGPGWRCVRDMAVIVSLVVAVVNTVSVAMAVAVALGTQWPWA